MGQGGPLVQMLFVYREKMDSGNELCQMNTQKTCQYPNIVSTILKSCPVDPTQRNLTLLNSAHSDATIIEPKCVCVGRWVRRHRGILT